jgi:hypothetical protein
MDMKDNTMTRWLGALALVVCGATSMGCYKYTIRVGDGGNLSGPPTRVEAANHFVYGAVGEGQLDITNVCPSGSATVKISQTVVDNVLQWALGGVLWQPSTMEVYCGNSRAASVLELDEERARQLAASPAFLDAVEALAPERMDEALAAHAWVAH